MSCNNVAILSHNSKMPASDPEEMPPHLVEEIVNINLSKWRGTLERWKEDDLRANDLYDAIFSEHNQTLAACIWLEAMDGDRQASTDQAHLNVIARMGAIRTRGDRRVLIASVKDRIA